MNNLDLLFIITAFIMYYYYYYYYFIIVNLGKKIMRITLVIIVSNYKLYQITK